MPFSLLPEPSHRLPLLAYAWIAVAILHILLWAGKLLHAAGFFILTALIGPDVSQPLPLWSWFAGPLFLLTSLVHWRRGSPRTPWGYAAATLLWIGLLASLSHLPSWLTGGSVAVALVTLALFVLPLALTLAMIRLVVNAETEARAA